MDGVIVAVAHDEFKNKPFLSTGSLFQTLGKFNHQTFKKGLIQTNAFRKSLIKNTSQLRRKINKCIEVRGMFDEEAAKGKEFYYRGL